MIQITAKIENNNMLKAIHRLAAASGLTVQFICFDQMRLLCRGLMKSTAPWAGGKPSNDEDAHQAGVKAIWADLFGSKKSAGIFGFLTPDMEHFLESDGNLPPRGVVKLKSGAVFGVDANLYKPGVGRSELQAHHLKYRGKNGRVTQAGTRTRNIGRWKFVDRMFTEKGTVIGYVQSVQARVGSLKAGWLPALRHYAGLSNAQETVPSWIASQKVQAGGFGGSVDREGNGMIYADNTAHHFNAIRPSTAQFEVTKREKHMERLMGLSFKNLVNQFNRGQFPDPVKIREAA